VGSATAVSRPRRGRGTTFSAQVTLFSRTGDLLVTGGNISNNVGLSNAATYDPPATLGPSRQHECGRWYRRHELAMEMCSSSRAMS